MLWTALYLPCHPKARTRQLGTAPEPQSLLPLVRLAKPTPPRLFRPMETTLKALAPRLTLILPRMAPLHGTPHVSRDL